MLRGHLRTHPRSRLAAVAALGVVGALGIGGVGLPGAAPGSGVAADVASGTRYDQNCDDDDYFTTGHNRDRSDDGCDTTRYGNTGHNGASAPDSWVYGHGRRDGDKPLGSGLFGGM